uniref:Uncharacterized protein n=1 Tax=Oryza nivara TaxID=4536 RepID=A0A0E0GC29_ORYNI
MAAARPNLDGALSRRITDGPARGAEASQTWRGGGESGLPAGGSGASTPELAGASRSRAATTGGGGHGGGGSGGRGGGGSAGRREEAAVEAATEAGTRVRLGRGRRAAGLEWRRRAAAFPVSAQAQMVQRELAAAGLRRPLVSGEAQAAEAMLPSPGFSFGQIWRGGRRVVERRGPGPALRDGGSRKSADGGASVRCGGSLVIGRTES